MAKVYIFLANGYEEIEGLTVVDLLRRANIDVQMVSVTGDIFVTGSHQITSKTDILFEEADFTDGDMLVLPGGMPGTKNLKEHAGLDALLKDYKAGGKKLAAICAAPSILGSKGLLQDRCATCYPGFEKELSGARVMDEEVVVDGNVITSKGMGTAIDFSLAIIEGLAGKAKAGEIARAIQFGHYK
ncbi:MAG TPA: DJ-1/PfpI family protein [Clostridiales bacterium]|nr:DJ-1/PfpI family protein [Clostridiales bacterium]